MLNEEGTNMNNEDFNWHVFLGFATVVVTAIVGFIIYILSMLSLSSLFHGIGIFLSIMVLGLIITYLLGVVGMVEEKIYNVIKYKEHKRWITKQKKELK